MISSEVREKGRDAAQWGSIRAYLEVLVRGDKRGCCTTAQAHHAVMQMRR